MRLRILAGLAAASAFGVIAAGGALGAREPQAAAPAVNYAREFALESVKKACAPAYRAYARAYSDAINTDARGRDACVPGSVHGATWPVLGACCKRLVSAEREVARCSYAAAGLDGKWAPGSTCEPCRCVGPVTERGRP